MPAAATHGQAMQLESETRRIGQFASSKREVYGMMYQNFGFSWVVPTPQVYQV